MTLRIRNDWKYEFEDWWKWGAFLDDSGTGDLEKVDYVEYILHPTFKNPVRKITDRGSGFRLSTSGWGVFLLRAIVHFKDGSTRNLSHSLVLRRDPATGVSK